MFIGAQQLVNKTPDEGKEILRDLGYEIYTDPIIHWKASLPNFDNQFKTRPLTVYCIKYHNATGKPFPNYWGFIASYTQFVSLQRSVDFNWHSHSIWPGTKTWKGNVLGQNQKTPEDFDKSLKKLDENLENIAFHLKMGVRLGTNKRSRHWILDQAKIRFDRSKNPASV